jgi:HNH endonuclease
VTSLLHSRENTAPADNAQVLSASATSSVLCELPTRRTQRILRRVAVLGPNECWLWQGSIRNSYGSYSGKYAHRVVWEILHGSIPVGLQVLHHCDNPPCVNPAHLFLGTIKDNHLDKAHKGRHGQQKKTRCPNGHPYTAENTVYTREGWRRCKICLKARTARRYA